MYMLVYVELFRYFMSLLHAHKCTTTCKINENMYNGFQRLFVPHYYCNAVRLISIYLASRSICVYIHIYTYTYIYIHIYIYIYIYIYT